MAVELLRAVFVSIVVSILPGYFWSRVLFAATDWAGRITGAIAFSITLVPAVALGLAAFFGPGITLPIALAAVLLVTLLGIAAHRLYGDAGGFDMTLQLCQRPLGTMALLPLVPAAALAVGAGLGAISLDRAVFFIVPLVVTSVVAHRIEHWRSSRQTPSQTDHPLFTLTRSVQNRYQPIDGVDGAMLSETSTSSAALRYLGSHRLWLAAVLLLVVARSYWGVVVHDWPYVRGMDLYAHAAMVHEVLQRGTTEAILVYPPGFHALVATMTRLGGPRPLEMFALLAPALLLLPTLACYVFAARLFGKGYGLAAALFAGVVGSSSYLFMYDGMYTNLIAGQFLFVLAVLSVLALMCAPSPRNVAVTALLGSAVVLYHQVASIYMVLILGIASVIFVPYLLFKERRTGVMMITALALLAGISILYAWEPYHLPETVAALFGRARSTGTTDHASIAVGTSQPRGASLYLGHISQGVAWLGLLGVLLLGSNLRRLRSHNLLATLLLLAWCVTFFVASRTSLSGFPVRFTRDLAIPLAIAAAFALVTLLRSFRGSRSALVLAGSVVSVVLVLGVQQGLARGSAPAINVFLTPAMAEAGEWLRAHNEGGSIIVSPHQNQVSGNAMLAMGEYSELPAYAPWQLGVRRQIPPRDHQAVRDGLSVLRRPGSRVAREEILERYDVRYVVIYKRLRAGSFWEGRNPVKWEPFLRWPRWYERAFENSDVIIFRVLRHA